MSDPQIPQIVAEETMDAIAQLIGYAVMIALSVFGAVVFSLLLFWKAAQQIIESTKTAGIWVEILNEVQRRREFKWQRGEPLNPRSSAPSADHSSADTSEVAP